MPYGFVLIRLAKKGDQARPTLEEAAPALAVLASQPVPQEISEKRVRQYYASHRDEFVRPDTIRLDADLRPRSTRHAAYAPMARRMVEAGSLPAEARGASGMFSALRPGDTLAPLGNAWGRWRFRVGEIRRGRDTIPFAEAAGRIRAELGEHDEESALRAAQEQVAAKGFDKERTVFRTALEEAYAPSTALLDSIASAADPENLGAYGPADRPEERITQFKDMERRQRARQAVDSLHAVWIRANIR
jgi:hypothetical protein